MYSIYNFTSLDTILSTSAEILCTLTLPALLTFFGSGVALWQNLWPRLSNHLDHLAIITFHVCVFSNSRKKLNFKGCRIIFFITFEAIQIPPWNLNHVISVAAEGFYCFTSLLCLGLGSEDLILSWNLTAIKTPAHKNQTMQLRLIFKTLSEESLKTIKGDSDYTPQNTVKICFMLSFYFCNQE